MRELDQFMTVSKELKTLLEGEFLIEQREEQIEKMDELLEKRQNFLNELSDLSHLNEETKLELARQEQEIQALMEQRKNMIKQDIKTLQLKKQKNEQYANLYENLSVDGMFLDKKK
ncbi:hypothetical protein PZE06_06640 [Robertmurraya sp. DFI.2.37]|uniref:hypothetical protein n=1 Tax=Robertmurraya sp. DFI.2.37 TaxID=3031819 RepID=UPI000BA5A71D|nr:hypothetical protein [Robertmurraya sp. DFI.2.37]MDF1507858.1 hypothetical protein [Robertmurraya sp. DFI.2.37]PAE19798.1 hypothetical protein CHH80_14770 [Bacillus sp. 7504-2]